MEFLTALILPVIKTYYGTEMDALDRRFCVMRAISQKLYDMDEDSYNDAKQYICEHIYTSLDEDESIGLLRDFCKVEEYLVFPYAETCRTGNLGARGSYIASGNLAKDVSRLHSYIYGTQGYVPTEAVTTFSSEIDELIKEYER